MMPSKNKHVCDASSPGPFARFARVALIAFTVGVIGACSTAPASAPYARAAASLDQGLVAPSARQTGLGPTRLKRRVRVLEHEAPSSSQSAGDGRTTASAEGRGSAPRRTLERALIKSGRYEVVEAAAGATRDADALQMSVELLEDDEVTAVRLHIRDPRTSAAAMVFSGEGVAVQSRSGVFNRADEAQARALAFAVDQALRSASAVLASLPWQAPVLEVSDEGTLLIPGGKQLGLKPGVLLSIQARERVLGRSGTQAQVAIASRLVGEVLIVDNLDGPNRDGVSVGALVSGSLKGYDARELVVRFCQPKGYFGHDFGHDHQCSAKAAARVSFDPDSALLNFSPESVEDDEFLPVPHLAPAVAPPSAVF